MDAIRREKPRWMVYAKKADFNGLARRFGISPVTARIIRNRDVMNEEEMERYLHGTPADFYDPHLFKDMDRAVGLIAQKIWQGAHIRIVGDYDIDGVCSTYLLYKGFRRCGAAADYQIPERIKDGYGINESIIEKAAADGVDTIVTCDNGIAAYHQICRAKELGLTVIVTDHHEVPKSEDGSEKCPPADAIVNPKQADCAYPYKNICGGVVAYKLIGLLYETMGVPRREWEEMLEFAAIATVGDVMPLKGENRIIVKWGLKQIPKTKSLGLKCLVEACGLDAAKLSAYHIGFVIGPCLNASGRLETAKQALELLLADDEGTARSLAERLQQLNEERKDLTKQGVDEALKQVEERYAADPVLTIFLPDCHESVAGIIAGRVREAWNRPTFVLTRSEDGVKGSGRSIPAYHMFNHLCEVQDLLTKFGGHPLAAGFSLHEDDVEEFRRRLNENAGLTQADFIPKVWVDAVMPLEYVSQRLVKELKILEPFGQGNEKPQFAQKGLYIRDCRVMGKQRNVVRMTLVTPQGLPMAAILFADGDRFTEERQGYRHMDVIYYPDINEYNGYWSLQIVIKEYKLRA